MVKIQMERDSGFRSNSIPYAIGVPIDVRIQRDSGNEQIEWHKAFVMSFLWIALA